MTEPTDSLAVGIVVERRDSDNRWQDHVWRPVAIIPGAPARGDWKVLRRGEGWEHYHAATLELELFRKETDGYRNNLAQATPVAFVVLRPGEEKDDPEVVPFHVTVCPYEAADYMESGDEIVEGVPLPDAVAAWLGEFVERHHVEVEFKKRKRKPHRDREEGPRRRERGA